MSKIRLRSKRAPGRRRANGHRPDSTKTYEEVSIVTSTVTPGRAA